MPLILCSIDQANSQGSPLPVYLGPDPIEWLAVPLNTSCCFISLGFSKLFLLPRTPHPPLPTWPSQPGEHQHTFQSPAHCPLYLPGRTDLSFLVAPTIPCTDVCQPTDNTLLYDKSQQMYSVVSNCNLSIGQSWALFISEFQEHNK